MTADTVGGVWTYAIALSRALADFEVHVTLAVLGPPPSRAQLGDLLTLPNVDWCHRPGPLEWMPHGPEAVDDVGVWLRSVAARSAPDVVHVNGYGAAAASFQCPVLVVAHSCVCSWWRAVKREAAPDALAPYRTMVQRGLGAADLVVAPTHAMLAALAAEYDVPRPSRVIPNGSDVRVPTTWAKEPLIFSAARFDDEAKNLTMLERVAPALSWPVVVAGGAGGAAADLGSDPGDAPTQGVESDRHRGLTPLGRIDHAMVLAWLARASIYAHPARYEPFGLSVLEAAQLRCALVLGDIPSLREVWGSAAIYVDPDDAAAIEQQVNRLARHDRLRHRMANAARHRAERYSTRACASAYVRAYRSLAGAVHAADVPRAVEVS